MAILVTGGAGYIGSHAVRALVRAGEAVVAYDNLSTGYAQAVKEAPLVVGSLEDTQKLESVIHQYHIDEVMHFAAFSLVAESMENPAKYYSNNVGGTISLLNTMRARDVKKIVFSSTAATFGDTAKDPIDEQTPQNPTSVYGHTKLMIEQILREYDRAYGMRSMVLRYFNVAGAHPDGDIGEAHTPETHLIPLIIKTIMGIRDRFTLMGTDYPTKDGTCIRDYIHVCDLVDAHVLALNALRQGKPSNAYNLGNGNGFSNREVLDTVQRVAGQRLAALEGPRRPGDPAKLVASSAKIMGELGWKPVYTDLEQIVSTAWNWHQTHPYGY